MSEARGAMWGRPGSGFWLCCLMSVRPWGQVPCPKPKRDTFVCRLEYQPLGMPC